MTTPTKTQPPNWIHRLRVAEGLSLRALARELGVTHVTVINWQNGHSRLSATSLSVLERLLVSRGYTRLVIPGHPEEHNTFGKLTTKQFYICLSCGLFEIVGVKEA